MNKVLISPIGTTDPIRNYYDGPMLHIARHLRPDKIVMILTEAMRRVDEQDNRFEAALKLVLPECRVEKIYTDIEDPSDFDRLAAVYQGVISRVVENHKGSALYANVTSGTPQMISALCMLISLSSVPIHAMQVKTPARAPNEDVPYYEKGLPMEEVMDLNYDHNPETMTNRVVETEIYLFRRSLLLSQIESLIRDYNYGGALALAKLNQFLVPEALMALLSHAASRSSLYLLESNPTVKGINTDHLYPVKGTNRLHYKAYEYFNLIELNLRKQEYAEILLRMSPLLVIVAGELIHQQTGLKVIKDDGKLDVARIQRSAPELYDYMNDYFAGGIREDYAYLSSLIHIMEYFSQKCRINGDHYKALRILRQVELELRNPIAHTIVNKRDQDLDEVIQKMRRKDVQMPDHMDFETLVGMIRGLIEETIGKKNLPFVYDRLNQWILKSIHSEVKTG